MAVVLERFVGDPAATPSTYHGTDIPSGLRTATAGRLFESRGVGVGTGGTVWTR